MTVPLTKPLSKYWTAAPCETCGSFPAFRKAAEPARLGFICVDQPAGSERRQYFSDTRLGHRKAALAAPEYVSFLGDFFAHIPGAVHDDRSRRGIAVAIVETLEAN